jgi:hypothetical protein
VAEVPGLHSARWLLLDDTGTTQNGSAHEDSSAPLQGPLVFAFVCDGWPRDVLDELAERVGSHLDAILEHCEAYPGHPTPEQRARYLLEHRVRSQYLVSDPRKHAGHNPDLIASSREIQRALTLRRHFVQLAARAQVASVEEQQRRFESFRAQHAPGPQEASPAPGYPFEPSTFERLLDHEGMWIRRTAEIVRARARRDVRARARAGRSPRGLRGVHAKHHGLMKASLQIREDLPERFAVGLFKPGHKYECWVRVSNTQPVPQADYRPDGRGIALKILRVEGRPAVPFRLPNGLDGPDADATTQDFAMVSHPTFFVKDARDYAIMRGLFDANTDGRLEQLSVTAGSALYMLRRPRASWLLLRTLMRVPRNPLSVTYHSMVPCLLGSREAVKLSIRPSEATRRMLNGESLRDLLWGSLVDPHNYLRSALQRSLNLLGSGRLELELVAHVPGEQLPPIEDPRLDWQDYGARQVVLATLSIAQQDATSPEQRARAERMIFTPWHCLAEHRPLGSLSRARLFAYLASSEERNQPRPRIVRDEEYEVPPLEGVQ